jgi:hypothetical protein
MIDWAALEEADLEVRNVSRVLQRVLLEAHEHRLIDLGAGQKIGSKARAFLKELPKSQEIHSGRFVLESALQEKASPSVVAECMISQLFNRAVYNISLPKNAFLTDILMLLEEAALPSCLAVFRAMRHLGLHNRFVPPAGHIAETISAEESRLHAQMRDLVRFDKLLANCARLGLQAPASKPPRCRGVSR